MGQFAGVKIKHSSRKSRNSTEVREANGWLSETIKSNESWKNGNRSSPKLALVLRKSQNQFPHQ